MDKATYYINIHWWLINHQLQDHSWLFQNEIYQAYKTVHESIGDWSYY